MFTKKSVSLAALVASASFAISPDALSGWTVPVDSIEASFLCHGLAPDLAAAPLVNAILGTHGGRRVGGIESSSRFALRGEELVLNDDSGALQRLGWLAVPPTCHVLDAGEPAVPNWTRVVTPDGERLNVEFEARPETCRQALLSPRLFERLDAYRLVRRDGAVLLAWHEASVHPDREACLSSQ